MENQEKYICQYCGSVRKSIYSLAGHERLCEKNQTENGLVNRLLNADKLRKMTENATKKNTLEKKEYIFKCPRCGNDFSLLLNENEYKNGNHKIYCSCKCSNIREHSKETKEKISNGVKRHFDKFGVIVNAKGGNFVRPRKEKIKRFCKCCSKQLSFRNKSGFCRKCYSKYTVVTPEVREKLSQIHLQKVADGTHQGWKTRNIKSYAEIFWETVLNNNYIAYEREKKVGKYFLDFVIGKIDLEIDGKQHQYEDRKQSDNLRDEFLTKEGYFVYRIKWNEINSTEGKQMMKEKIELFLEFYKTFN